MQCKADLKLRDHNYSLNCTPLDPIANATLIKNFFCVKKSVVPSISFTDSKGTLIKKEL